MPVEKKEKKIKKRKFSFFRNIFIPFVIISVLVSMYSYAFTLAFLIDNSEAVKISRETGVGKSEAINKSLNTSFGKVYDKKKTLPKNRKKLSQKQRNRDLLNGIIHLIFLFLLYRWMKPFFKYLKTKDDEFKEKAFNVFNNIYKGVYLYVAGIYILKFIKNYMIFKSIPSLKHAVVYYAFTAVMECYLLYIWIEPTMFTAVSRHMYSKDELYGFKQKKTPSINTKLILMMFFLILLPMIFVLRYIQMDYLVLTAYKGTTAFIFVVSIFLVIGNLQLHYKSIQIPLRILGERMEKLSGGDFDVHTSVLYNDEIGKLKANFNLMVDQLKEREEIKETFGKYVSIEVARQLIEEKKINLGGENIEATILFSDIRNFTTMSEKMSPEEVVAFLNNYFSYITDPIMENHGIINKFIGDAVMAIFTPHLGSVNHADDAMNAALGMARKLDEFNKTGFLPHEIKFGVGLNTGHLVAGNIGTRERVEYTVIGDTVNIASRLESKTKELESSIVIAESTYNAVSEKIRNENTFNLISSVNLKGRKEAVNIYRVE